MQSESENPQFAKFPKIRRIAIPNGKYIFQFHT